MQPSVRGGVAWRVVARRVRRVCVSEHGAACAGRGARPTWPSERLTPYRYQFPTLPGSSGKVAHFGLAIFIGIFFSLQQNQILPNRSEIEEISSDVPVVQKLAVIFGDGTTLFLAMNKTLNLNVLRTHRFHYDNCGFFAYDHPNHIQTLVGSSGKLNYIHDSNFNSKKIL